MFELSLSEILIVAVVALLVLKPDDLPEIMRWCGKMVAKVKKMASEFTDLADNIKKEIDVGGEIKSEVTKIKGITGEMYEAFDVSDLSEIDSSRKNEISNLPSGKETKPPHP